MLGLGFILMLVLAMVFLFYLYRVNSGKSNRG